MIIGLAQNYCMICGKIRAQSTRNDKCVSSGVMVVEDLWYMATVSQHPSPMNVLRVCVVPRYGIYINHNTLLAIWHHGTMHRSEERRVVGQIIIPYFTLYHTTVWISVIICDLPYDIIFSVIYYDYDWQPCTLLFISGQYCSWTETSSNVCLCLKCLPYIYRR